MAEVAARYGLSEWRLYDACRRWPCPIGRCRGAGLRFLADEFDALDDGAELEALNCPTVAASSDHSTTDGAHEHAAHGRRPPRRPRGRPRRARLGDAETGRQILDDLLIELEPRRAETLVTAARTRGGRVSDRRRCARRIRERLGTLATATSNILPTAQFGKGTNTEDVIRAPMIDRAVHVARTRLPTSSAEPDPAPYPSLSRTTNRPSRPGDRTIYGRPRRARRGAARARRARPRRASWRRFPGAGPVIIDLEEVDQAATTRPPRLATPRLLRVLDGYPRQRPTPARHRVSSTRTAVRRRRSTTR